MARLIILGNGYDISRLKGKTKYKEFGKWLCNKYNLEICKENKINFSKNASAYGENFYTTFENIPAHIVDDIDKERKEVLATVLVNMMKDIEEDDTWSCFEENLAKLPWKKYIEEANEFYKGEKNLGDPTPFGETFITSLPEVVQKLFAEWVNQIKVDKIKKENFEETLGNINNDDIILIFNYTDTFEHIFSLSDNDTRVFHIHGTAKDKKSIIVGHGDKRKSKPTCLINEEDYISEAEFYLYKNVCSIIKKNDELWKKIKKFFGMSENNEIYVYGWKGIGVDEPYIKKIVKIVKETNKSCQLYLSNYNGDGIEKKDCWKKNNFKGEIKLFDA